MKTKLPSCAFVPAFLVVALCALPLSAVADNSTPKEPDLWAASANAPLTFTIPASQAPRIMDKAQVLIAEWCSIDSVNAAMEIRVATNSIIEADTVTSQSGMFKVMDQDPETVHFGFSVVCSPTQDGDDISINTLYPLDKDNDSARRGRLLAYLLQQYAATLTATPTDLEAHMKDLHSQLDSGQYASAVATIDALRADVVAKEAAQESAPATTP